MRATGRTWIFVCAISVLAGGPALGSPSSEGADPAINRPFVDAEFERWVQRFERPGREVYDKRHEIVDATGVRPGMAVADIGAGTGLHTWLFAERVGPKGQVYAIDISPVFIENIERIARERGLEHVTALRNEPDDVLLPPDSIDLAFLSNVYHHFERPQTMMETVHRALRSGGTLVVIDFERHEGAGEWVHRHVRAGRETAIEEIKAAGFELLGSEDLLDENYFLRFTKP
jgi:ubiquinone/menaquinone biosynthesis C-methylase UbiE